MGFLSLEPGNVNELTPGFKVRHTSCPYAAFRDGQLFMLGGNTGVDTQTQGQVQQFLSIVEWDTTAQEAVAQPRFVTTAFPATTSPYDAENTLQMEAGFRGSVVTELRERGHDIDLGDGRFGSANMIVLRDEGVEVGVEPRSDTAAGEVIPAGS
jgi:gamma-glutamyltranspeptidase / glutathione hydrolase